EPVGARLRGKILFSGGLLRSGGARLANEAVDGFGRLGTDGQPFVSLLKVDLVIGAFDQRVVGADLLDVAAVAALAAVHGYDFVVGAVFGALAVEAERY